MYVNVSRLAAFLKSLLCVVCVMFHFRFIFGFGFKVFLFLYFWSFSLVLCCVISYPVRWHFTCLTLEFAIIFSCFGLPLSSHSL